MDDITENEFALAPGVARINHRGHVLAFEQLENGLQPRFALLDGLEVKVRRDHRQIRKRPLAALDLELLGDAQLQQMPHRRSDDILVIFKVVVMFFKFAERPRDVSRIRRLFRDD